MSDNESHTFMNGLVRTLIHPLFLLFIIIALFAVIVVFFLLQLVPNLSVPDIVNFFIIFLNLIATYALTLVSLRLLKIEQKRDTTHADIEQKGEWRSIVNQLHERVIIINKEVGKIQFHSSALSIGTYAIRNISIHYLLIISDIEQLQDHKPKGEKETILEGKDRENDENETVEPSEKIQDVEEYAEEDILELSEEILDRAENAREILKIILENLEQDNIKLAEDNFKKFSEKHYELIAQALNSYDPYNF